jgi:hypothetical protein
MGKAAALIVISLALGFIVVNDNSSSGFTSVAASRSIRDNFTETTSKPHGATTTTAAPSAERQPKDIKVIAINATGTKGKGGQATATLRTAGYNALQPGNATASVTASHPASVVYYTAGYKAEALTVAALFGLPDSAVREMPNPLPSPDIKPDANIALLVGTGIKL